MREFPETMPLIKPEQGTDQTTVARINTFDKSIHEDPYSFIQALDALDVNSTNPTLSVLEQVTLPRNISADISRQIIDFFFKRDDKLISYDEETEQQIKTDEQHKGLLADFNATKEVAPRAGQENEAAINARDALRRFRLRFYIGRVVSFQAKQQSESVEAKESIFINS